MRTLTPLTPLTLHSLIHFVSTTTTTTTTISNHLISSFHPPHIARVFHADQRAECEQQQRGDNQRLGAHVPHTRGASGHWQQGLAVSRRRHTRGGAAGASLHHCITGSCSHVHNTQHTHTHTTHNPAWPCSACHHSHLHTVLLRPAPGKCTHSLQTTFTLSGCC